MLDVQAKTPLGLASRPARAEQPWHQDLCRVVSVFILDWFLVLTLYHILAVRCRQECKWHCERQQSLLIVVFLMLRVIDLLRLFHLFRREQQQRPYHPCGCNTSVLTTTRCYLKVIPSSGSAPSPTAVFVTGRSPPSSSQ